MCVCVCVLPRPLFPTQRSVARITLEEPEAKRSNHHGQVSHEQTEIVKEDGTAEQKESKGVEHRGTDLPRLEERQFDG